MGLCLYYSFSGGRSTSLHKNRDGIKVWTFTIGGYPVVKKWLDYRHFDKLKRPLHSDEVRCVTEMVQRIAAILDLGALLDANYITIKGSALAVGRAVSTSGFSA
jgi:hypothetical protein